VGQKAAQSLHIKGPSAVLGNVVLYCPLRLCLSSMDCVGTCRRLWLRPGMVQHEKEDAAIQTSHLTGFL
jgi:hypothetical protein